MVFTNKYASILVDKFPDFGNSVALKEEYALFGEDQFNVHALFTALTNYVIDEVIKNNTKITDFERELYNFVEECRVKFKLYAEDSEEGEFDNAVCTCFLENLLNRASSYNELYQRFIPYLGPYSIEYCKAWDKFTEVRSPGLWTDEEWASAVKDQNQKKLSTHRGLDREENKGCDLEGKCLWVPASVKHHLASNASSFIYGGVRVMPRVNVVGSSDPRYGQMMGNAFNAQNRAMINNNQLRTTNSQTQAAGTFTARMTTELRKQGYQEHHVVSNKNSATTSNTAAVFVKAGIGFNDRLNKMFLPSREGVHPTRSIHSGRHMHSVNDSLQKKSNFVDNLGKKHNWSQNQYRKAVVEIIQRERGLLRSGERSLNKNKAPNARPQSPPLNE